LVQASRDDGFSFWPTMRANDYQPICWHRARMINRGERPNRNGGNANLNDYAGVWAIRLGWTACDASGTPSYHK